MIQIIKAKGRKKRIGRTRARICDWCRRAPADFRKRRSIDESPAIAGKVRGLAPPEHPIQPGHRVRRSSWGGSKQRVASYERELTEHRATEIRLRGGLVRSEALLREKEEVIRRQELLHQECRYRLLNNLSIIVSLLSLQSRRETNAEAASRLAIAATRVRAISGLHQHLHSMDGMQTVEFRRYLDKLCRDHSTLSVSEECLDRPIIVEAIELNVPPTTGIPLSLIVSELVTNAIKHGGGKSR